MPDAFYVLDFEMAMYKECERLGLRTGGCWFHLNQTVLRQIGKKGLGSWEDREESGAKGAAKKRD